ncbi:uncharacterized protein LOC141711188 [Apium graveolens]|uniref:uncharacterized protein LOC141711188 n=1 Tax=Apium graveolens TaxID=4045 RepID=UPI003D79EDDE
MSKTPTIDVNKLKGGSIGLSYPMLTKTNYTSWALKMKVFMQEQGVWSVVEPSDPKAAITEKSDKSDPKAAIVEKSDKISMAMIYHGIPEEILFPLAEKKIAKEVWETIKLRQGVDPMKQARIQTLKYKFEALSMKESEQIDDFHLKMNGLVMNIRALWEEMDEAYVVKKLLRAVPSRFLQITSTMEKFGDLETMSVEEALGSLKAHEERMVGKTEPKESQLLLTKEEWKKREDDEKKLLFTREEWLRRVNNEGSSNFRC